jgi:hypothetical protein
MERLLLSYLTCSSDKEIAVFAAVIAAGSEV